MRDVNSTSLTSLLLACLAGLLIGGCSKPGSAPATSKGSPVANEAALVNGEAIPLDEFYKHMALKETAQVMSEKGPADARVLGNFGLQALQELVDQKVLLQMAKEDGVLPTSVDVDAELNFQISLRPTYLNMLQDQGLSMEMIRQDLLVGLAREHLVTKGVTVDATEVDKYIKSHPDSFKDPATAALLYVQVDSEAKKNRVDFALGGGKQFADVAAEHSQAPNARATKGAYPGQVVSQMPKPIQAAVEKTSVKGTSGWISLGQSFVKIYVVQKTPAKALQPTTAQKELIKRGIALSKGRLQNGFEKKFFDKLRASKVSLSIPYLKDAWAKTWNQLSETTPRSSQTK